MKEKIETLFGNYNFPEDNKKLYIYLSLNIWEMVKTAYVSDETHNENHILHVLRRGIDLVLWLKSDKYDTPIVNEYIIKLILASFMHDIYSSTDRKHHHTKAYELLRKICDYKILLQNFDIYNTDKIVKTSDTEIEILNLIPGQSPDQASSKLSWIRHYHKHDLICISHAVNEHRASYEGDFNSEFSELFSAADRDDLDLNVVINRIYKCAIDKTNIFNCDLNNFSTLDIIIDGVEYKSNLIINNLKCDDIIIKTFYHLWEKFSRVGYMYKNIKSNGIYMSYYKNQIDDFHNEIDKIIKNPLKILDYIKELK